jgi:hypothetical protein
MVSQTNTPGMPEGAISVREALSRHYVAHGLPEDGGATASWFRVRIGPVSLRLPNPPARRRAVFFHDVNHVVTGYDTTFSRGEMAIAAFEVGAGCGTFGLVWFINLTMFALGLVVHPHALFMAFVRGRHSKSIYHLRPEPAVLAGLSVADVRHRLGVDVPPRPPRPTDYLAFGVWGFAAAAVLFAPATLVLAGLSRVMRL